MKAHRVRQLWFLAISGFLLCSVVAAKAGDGGDLGKTLRELQAPILPAEDNAGQKVRSMLADDARERLHQANVRETRAWRKLKGRKDWEKYRNARIKKLEESLGNISRDFPADVHHVTKEIKGDGYRIKNVIFASKRNLYVTANLYLPVKHTQNMPGIIICHSHHNPKTQGELQDMGVTFARLGCAVLVMDQLGHGERRQHPFVNSKSYAKSFRVSRQDYYFRYNVALQLHLVGESLMGWMVDDMREAINQLNIHTKRVGGPTILFGAVAGGGDPAAVTAALDKRINAVVPFNFGGPQPENRFPLPPDAEDRFNYAGSGSWESTRNLKWSARDGFLPWVIVGAAAPRRLGYAHEFAWDEKNDPVWKRLGQIFKWYGHPEYLSSVKGRGSVRGRPPESTHCNNIGAVHRKQIYPSLKKWFGIPIPEKEFSQRRSSDELRCLTPQWRKKMKPVHQFAREIAAVELRDLRKKAKALSLNKRRNAMRRRWSELLGRSFAHKPRINQKKREVRKIGEIVVAKIVLSTERKIDVPLLILRLGKFKKGSPVVVAIAQQGKAGFLKHRTEEIAELLKSGIAVCLPDLRGAGETAPGTGRARRSWITSISATHLMLGDTIRGGQVHDLLSVLAYLRANRGVDANRIAIWGDSFAPVNSPKRNLAVPRGIDNYPEQAEPMGTTVALLAALFDDRVNAVYARRGIASWLSMLDSPFLYMPHDEVVPNMLSAGDVADLAAALSPMPLHLEALVDGRNRQVSAKELREYLAPTAAAYKGAKAEYAFRIEVGSPAAWLQGRLRNGS